MEEDYEDLADQGFIVLDVIIEDERGNAPDQADLESWVSTYDLTMPVLADPRSKQLWNFADGASSVGLPYTVLFDVGLEIVDNNNPTFRDAERLLGE